MLDCLSENHHLKISLFVGEDLLLGWVVHKGYLRKSAQDLGSGEV